MRQPKPSAFESTIEPELERLFRTAFRLSGNRADAEDLLQETCVAAFENLAALTSADHPDRWLMRVLYNRFIDGTRRRERSPIVALEPGPESPAFASRGPGPEELAEQSQSEAAFHRAWSKLNDDQCALLSLRAEGFGLTEIEDITGISKDVLRARLHRARVSLARHMEQPIDEAEQASRFGSSQ